MPQDPRLDALFHALSGAAVGGPNLGTRELSDPNWRKYFDGLKAAGVDELSTSEASGQNDPYSKLRAPIETVAPGDIRTRQPGYFDQKNPNAGAIRQLAAAIAQQRGIR